MTTALYIQDKRAIWRSVQRRRDAWENKFVFLFRVTLNKQFKELAGRINAGNVGSTTLLGIIKKEPIQQRMIELYKAVGSDFARSQFETLKNEPIDLLMKVETEDQWLNFMDNYVRRRLWKRIEKINQTSIDLAGKIINETLAEGVAEGLGADAMATKVKKNLIQKGVEYNQWRALRVARTEIMTASNIGSLEGAKATGEMLEKLWIATYDNRSRDNHPAIEQQNPKRMDEGFRVGAYLMECPGDPDAGPEEVINCRCAMAFNVVGW